MVACLRKSMCTDREALHNPLSILGLCELHWTMSKMESHYNPVPQKHGSPANARHADDCVGTSEIAIYY